ncbi:glycosyltransferase family 59 protein [Phanerochaete carnosa HHB-10118-sp]|uniref:Dol-P-Glc:Glc(2)Man(9)GlcNAc(2)-PP-Dol alpha-1,2-glucosyltransferase n=1 Tax=Phanerochaete carnosa (strain HHB-10118-sp) TaxID=650164 RepID=K5XCQ6_PHACS|nr:glycosyltransferase family 59 protein [Phanerochaete carnosa HHB-10118-sp]EKM60782.1 glycosyltransferase family 59 protein [Phanerochaete carnosa HHB-10118-sp]
MLPASLGPTVYLAFCASSVLVLKAMNEAVIEPYMDEPFHVPQAQAYCIGNYSYWDPKITTPPGLYILSLILKRIFMLKCNLAMLRLTPLLALLVLPLVLTRLLCFHKRERPPTSLFAPTPEAVVLSAFPVAWFFGFLYYTEVPSLVFVALTVVAATHDKHWFAALFGAVSCTFRQTNVIWVLYAYAASQLMSLRFRRAAPGAKPVKKLHDPPAVAATPVDLLQAILSAPKVIPDILPAFVPYALVIVAFAVFVFWNGGIVLGDKSNHIPSFHVPQLYYFVGFATLIGWPALVSTPGGLQVLVQGVRQRINTALTCLLSAGMALTVYKFTIHHPFLLADNRHYTFYVWRRVFRLHPVVPYLLIPGYIACTWAWYLRIGHDQTLLQNLLVALFVTPTLLPTPLLEPRYFLIPYVLLRAQVSDVTGWGMALEGLWYAGINAATMWVFLYKEREGVGRFMW